MPYPYLLYSKGLINQHYICMQFAISMWISMFSSCKGSTICWYLNFVKFLSFLILIWNGSNVEWISNIYASNHVHESRRDGSPLILKYYHYWMRKRTLLHTISHYILILYSLTFDTLTSVCVFSIARKWAWKIPVISYNGYNSWILIVILTLYSKKKLEWMGNVSCMQFTILVGKFFYLESI